MVSGLLSAAKSRYFIRTVYGLLLLLCCLTNTYDATAQTDTTAAKVSSADTLYHSPKKAALYSAVLPGLGQAYNKKYWKIPIVYGGISLSLFFVSDNNKQYKLYKNALVQRTDNDETTQDQFVNAYTEEDLRLLKNFYRRNRDLSYIAAGMIYILNIVDATVDAHLFYFNVNDDLSLWYTPAPVNGKAGVSLALRF